MAYGDKTRLEELRREIAEIRELNDVYKHSRETARGREEREKRGSRLAAIQAELQSMMKKGSGLQ